MEPMKVEKLPVDYVMDKELLRLLAEANSKYAEYKTYLRNVEFDQSFS